MKLVKEKIKRKQEQCNLCAAQFEIMLDNSKLSEERREKVSRHILKYCPVCARAS